jgi:hypothetical protein
METALIKNEYDGPAKKTRKIFGGQFSLDFAYSQDAQELDTGIRETIRGVKVSHNGNGYCPIPRRRFRPVYRPGVPQIRRIIYRPFSRGYRHGQDYSL